MFSVCFSLWKSSECHTINCQNVFISYFPLRARDLSQGWRQIAFYMDENEAVRHGLPVFHMHYKGSRLHKSFKNHNFQNRPMEFWSTQSCFASKLLKTSNTPYFYSLQHRFHSCQKLDMVLPWLKKFTCSLLTSWAETKPKQQSVSFST